MKKINIENIYKFIAALSIMQEHLAYCKDDLIEIQKKIVFDWIELSTDRKSKRSREREAEKNLAQYIASIEKMYNTATKIISGLEKDKEGEQLVDDMIDCLHEAINNIKIEIK